jgi:transposase-like protein
MSGNGKHCNWSSKDKLRIVLGAMQPGVEVSNFCRREGLNPVLSSKFKFRTFWRRSVSGTAGHP